ncbi:PRC-barrel domain-containing protein [Pseudalkalibacillus sp. SCS-8]|uniref:PRC-barrel domain-containing protein n=1 Tax=Pseudalkalibacillus nanhaiensis TaxID=3115291 RepID=UPI0032DA34DB
MLIFGKDILKKKIVSSEYGELDNHEVDDILLSKKTYDLEYLIYVEKRPDDHVGEKMDAPDDVVYSVGGQFDSNRSAETSGGSNFKNYIKETYYIPFSDVNELSDDMVRISGIDQQSHDPIDSISADAIIKQKVKTTSGETIGKVKDIVIDWETRRVVGLSISEGFWAKLMSDTNKYLRLEENMTLTAEEIIVPDHMKDHLVEDVEEVVPH